MPTPVAAHQVDVATDPVTRADLLALATAEGAHVSLLMPTPRMGPGTRQVGRQFSRLCDVLREAVVTRAVDPALVDRVVAATDRHDFWQNQAEGLAVVAGPAGLLVRRVGQPLRPEVAVGRPRLRPLLPHLVEGATFHVLALSTGSVRLFEGTEHSMRELELESVPSSYDEVVDDRDGRQSLQWSAQGGGTQNFHGHGADSAAERTDTEKFFRLVAQELRRRLPADGAESGPLVLACVPENLALFRAAGGHPQLLQDACVVGNADRLTGVELHRRAWPLAEPLLRVAERDAAAQVLELHGTGKVLTDLDQVLVAAWEGRVEWLFVRPEAAPATTETPVTDDPVDLVLCRVLAAGGHVAAPPPALRDSLDEELVALLRW
jgi:hypothetical protein